LQSSSQIDGKKHFREKINEILVLPGAKFTLFCLETQVQIYTRNGKDLFDIIACTDPKLTQAEILGDSLTIVYAGQKNRVEARTFTNLTETTFTLINDIEVGKISLSQGKVATISKDGCYVYVFALVGVSKDLQPT